MKHIFNENVLEPSIARYSFKNYDLAVQPNIILLTNSIASWSLEKILLYMQSSLQEII